MPAKAASASLLVVVLALGLDVSCGLRGHSLQLVSGDLHM